MASDPETVDTEKFEFDVGDVIVEKDEYAHSAEGVGIVTQTEYEINRRVVDADNGKRYYQVEYEDGPNVRECLKGAKMVHDLYRTVGTDTRGDSDEE